MTDPCYRAWAASGSSDILWLIGKPGSGKSTLLRKLLKEAQQPMDMPSLATMLNDFTDNGDGDRMRENFVEHKIVASYFYNFRNEHEKDHRRMLQSLLFQILTQEPLLYPLLRATYLRLRKHRRKTSVHWTVDELISIIHAITEFEVFRLRIEIYLDAVDESEESSYIVGILRQQLTRRTTSAVVIKTIVACRPMESFQKFPRTDKFTWRTITQKTSKTSSRRALRKSKGPW